MVGERSCAANRHIFTIYSPKHKLEMAQLKTSDFFLLLNVRYRTFRHCSQNLEAVKWKIV